MNDLDTPYCEDWLASPMRLMRVDAAGLGTYDLTTPHLGRHLPLLRRSVFPTPAPDSAIGPVAEALRALSLPRYDLAVAHADR